MVTESCWNENWANLAWSAATWAKFLKHWIESRLSGCIEPLWSPSLYSHQTCLVSIFRHEQSKVSGNQEIKHCAAAKFYTSYWTHRLRNIENAAYVEGSISTVVQYVARFIICLSYIPIKFIMLPITDLFGVHHPESLERKCTGFYVSKQ